MPSVASKVRILMFRVKLCSTTKVLGAENVEELNAITYC